MIDLVCQQVIDEFGDIIDVQDLVSAIEQVLDAGGDIINGER